MSQKYVIVHFVDLARTPHEFSYTEWPPHVTLLANFTIDQPVDALVSELASYAQQTEPFEIRVEGEALFGPNQDVPVLLMQTTADIQKVHEDLADLTGVLGAKYDDPQYMRVGYRPHMTIKAKTQTGVQQAMTLDSLTLIDMYPDGDITRRRVIKSFVLTP